MNLGIEGKVVCVTGGGRGIGAAIALELASNGADVAIVDLGQIEAAKQVCDKITRAGRRGRAYRSDVSVAADAEATVAAIVRDFGRLDILVCNAGVTRDSVIWKMAEEQWDQVIAINLKGAFNYCKAAAPVFRKQGSGKIVTIASINGMRGKFGQTNYAASKGGLISLSKSLAKELGRFGVNVNVVAPGMVETEMAKTIPEEFLKEAIEETVLGRLARPEDVAAAVVFLSSDWASHITGEVVKVDGGQYI